MTTRTPPKSRSNREFDPPPPYTEHEEQPASTTTRRPPSSPQPTATFAEQVEAGLDASTLSWISKLSDSGIDTMKYTAIQEAKLTQHLKEQEEQKRKVARLGGQADDLEMAIKRKKDWREMRATEAGLWIWACCQISRNDRSRAS